MIFCSGFKTTSQVDTDAGTLWLIIHNDFKTTTQVKGTLAFDNHSPGQQAWELEQQLHQLSGKKSSKSHQFESSDGIWRTRWGWGDEVMGGRRDRLCCCSSWDCCRRMWGEDWFEYLNSFPRWWMARLTALCTSRACSPSTSTGRWMNRQHWIQMESSKYERARMTELR